MKQVRLTIASNAGGSGKSTLALHLAFEVAKLGYKVILIELDPNNSFRVFLGLEAETDNSIASVLKQGFQGEYPLIPIWLEYVKNLSAIAGGKPLAELQQELGSYPRREYTLSDRLQDFPLDADLVIFDTPASLEPFGVLALAASTHVIAPIKPEYKDVGSFDGFLQWFYEQILSLRLNPKPELLGFVPTRIDLSKATHRNILGLDAKGKKSAIPLEDTLPGAIAANGIDCFPPIRESNYFLTASGCGVPVGVYRSGSPAAKSFEMLAATVISKIKGQ